MTRYLASTQLSTGVQPQPSSHHDLLQLADVLQVVRFVWRHKLRIAFGVAVAVTLGWMYYSRSPEVYESQAQLLVVRKNPLALNGVGGGPAAAENEPTTHLLLIKSPWFVRRVIDDYDLEKLASFADGGDAAQTLISSLSVVHENELDEVVSDNTIFRFVFRSRWPGDCPTVVNAILASYQQYLHESDRSGNENVLQLITQKADQIQDELRRKEAEYHSFREATPLLSNGDGSSSASVAQLAEIESKRVDLAIRRAEAESRLAAIRRGLQDNPLATTALVPVDFREEGIPKSTSRERFQERLDEALLPLLVEERKLSVDFGPGYPRLQELREQIQLTHETMMASYNAVAGSATPAQPVRNPTSGETAQRYSEYLEQELKDIAAAEESLAAQLRNEQNETRELAIYELKSQRYINEIARAERLHDTLITQLRSVDLSKDYGGYNTTVISPTSEAVQVEPNALLILAVSALFGIVSGIGWAGWSELSDTRFRDTEAVRGLGLPVLGQLPLLSVSRRERFLGQSAGAIRDPFLCTYERPDSTSSESFRDLRTALFFCNQSENNKLVQITSPADGDGKSTLASNLAVSIAQSGKRVLLIDADLRRPRIDRIFDVEGDRGLVTVLTGQMEPSEVIQASQIGGLSVMPAGPLPSNPADLLSTPMLRELLSVVRDQFDYVLIDTPPLLAVSDARIVAALSDGVLLTFRLGRNDRLRTRQASEVLRMVGANILGVVINGDANAARRDDRYTPVAGRNGSARHDGLQIRDASPLVSNHGQNVVAP